jgi:hypothetical protein
MASGISGGKANHDKKATKKLTIESIKSAGLKTRTKKERGPRKHTPTEVKSPRIRIIQGQDGQRIAFEI